MATAEVLADGTSFLFRGLNATYGGHNSTGHHDGSAHAEEHHSVGTDVLIAVIMFLFLGTFIRSFIRKFELPIPYTVCLLIVSFLWGCVYDSAKTLPGWFTLTPLGALEYLAKGTEVLIEIDPHVFLMVFIPPLIFESAFSVNYHTFTMVANQALILAGPGVLISSLLTAAISMALFDWTFAQSLMFGAIISATDPVAVVALLRDLGASKKLATLIEGESLLNDGTAVVLYFIVQGVVLNGDVPSVGDIFAKFGYKAIGGIFWGIIAGWIIGMWLGQINDDFLIEASLTFAGAIWCFWGGYWMGVSDILAVVAFGLYLSKNETLISPKAQHALHYIWEWLAYVANTLIFELTGVLVANGVKDSIDWNDLWKNFMLFLALNVIRLIVIGVCFPCTSKLGYGVGINDCVVQVVGALRGAIGLAVAILTELEIGLSRNADELELLGKQIMLHTSLIVVWTLLVNAVVMPYIVKYLEMDKLTEEGQVIFHQVIQRMQVEEKNLLASMKCDHMYSATDWDQIKKTMPDFNALKMKVFRKDKNRDISMLHSEGKIGTKIISTGASKLEKQSSDKFNARKSVFAIQHQRKMQSDREPSSTRNDARYSVELAQYITMCDESSLMFEIRQRVLATVRASYWHQFHEGMITEEATRLLVESAEVAMDKGSLQSQWNHVSGYIILPDWIQDLHERDIPIINYFVRWYLNEKLNVGIQLCEAFIESYQKVRTMFETFPEFADLPMAQKVVDEGKKIDEIAKLALLKLKIHYSDVYRSIKTYQAAMFILNQQKKTVKNLHNAGVMEDKEFSKVIKYIDKYAFSARQLYRKASHSDKANLALAIFRNLPWLSHLDEDLCRQLFDKCEVVTEPENTRLHKEGEDMEHLYVVVDGVLAFKRNGETIETRECGQFMGLIAILGCDTMHADVVTGSKTLMIKVPKNIVDDMFDDEYTFKCVCQAAADVLIEAYFSDFFSHETSLETNYRVQTGRVIEVDASVVHLKVRSEALLLKGVATEKNSGANPEAPGDHMICAPALLLPNSDGYECFQDAVIIELASKESVHAAHVDFDNINIDNSEMEHLDRESDFDKQSTSEINVSIEAPSSSSNSLSKSDQTNAQKLIYRHNSAMANYVQRPVANHGCDKALLRGSNLSSGGKIAGPGPQRRMKPKASVFTSDMFKNTRNYTKYGKIELEDVIMEESDVESFSEDEIVSPSNLIQQKLDISTITKLKSKAKALKFKQSIMR